MSRAEFVLPEQMAIAQEVSSPRIERPHKELSPWLQAPLDDPDPISDAVPQGRIGRLIAESLHPSDALVPDDAQTLIVHRETSTGLAIWQESGAPEDGLESDCIKRDRAGLWWVRRWSSEAADGLSEAAPFSLTLATPSKQKIPPKTRLVMTTFNGIQLWRPVVLPKAARESEVLKCDAAGRWWQRVHDSRIPTHRATRIYDSRADAIMRMRRDPLPAAIHNVLVIEAGQVVLRARDSHEDPLFAVPPHWGRRLVLGASQSQPRTTGAEGYIRGAGAIRRRIPLMPVEMMQLAALRGGVGAAPPLDLYKDSSFETGTGWLGKLSIEPPRQACQMRTIYEPAADVIHPCVVEFFNEFCGFRYISAVTGFPSGKTRFENPFLYGSNDRVNWSFLGQTPQPLAPAPGEAGYNSDSFLAHDPRSGEIILGWRAFEPAEPAPEGGMAAGADRVVIRIRRTRDGHHWSEAREIFESDPRIRKELSPALIFDPETLIWHLWTINDAGIDHYTAASLDGNWRAESRIALPGFDRPHHHEIKWVGNRLVCLLHARGEGNLFFGVFNKGSFDRITWGRTGLFAPRPVSLYKASFVPVIDAEAKTLAFDIWWTAGAAGPAGGVDNGLGRALQYARTAAVPIEG